MAGLVDCCGYKWKSCKTYACGDKSANHIKNNIKSATMGNNPKLYIFLIDSASHRFMHLLFFVQVSWCIVEK